MADAPKLQLDPETGEMVSKGELKKRLAKRAKKAAQATKKQEAPKDLPIREAPVKKDEAPVDPNIMFKQGWLSEVFKERPTSEVITRFPPEPNGYLHLGHAKAIAVNFGFAKYHGGKTNLRFDDTNPDAEEEIYFTAIENMIKWLGFKPDKVTYSSDNFQQLYDLAEKLIEVEKAYVCHCTDTQIKIQRGGDEGKIPRTRCEHSNQDIKTNLSKFRDMRDGKYAPMKAFLRMRQDIENGNPMMWDIAAYRIPKDEHAHYRTGNKWIIYPTYDFAHCLCDSFEGITHSLCTTEFILSRESYEWLNKSLGVYEPMQREYGRLNVEGTIMSKRKLKKLVDEKIVRGWDDPRLYTLIGIRRRGVPPGAILSFIGELGVTTNKTIIQTARFEQSVRRYLETKVPRIMLVLDPVAIVIHNIGDLEGTQVEIPLAPRNPEFGTYKVPVTSTIYIDRSDFRESPDADFFRLTLDQTVGLLNISQPIKAKSVSKHVDTGLVTEIHAEFAPDSGKPKAFIQWVPHGSKKVTARVQSALFKSSNPESIEGGFLNDINPNSETVYENALVNSGFDYVKNNGPWPQEEATNEAVGPEGVRFQALRVGYFAVDSDSTDDKIVLNRIVSLRDSKKD